MRIRPLRVEAREVKAPLPQDLASGRLGLVFQDLTPRWQLGRVVFEDPSGCKRHESGAVHKKKLRLKVEIVEEHQILLLPISPRVARHYQPWQPGRKSLKSTVKHIVITGTYLATAKYT